MNSLFDILASVIILQGLIGLIDGICYYRYIRAHLALRPRAWTPFASIILPCKGIDHELEKNVQAVLEQDYPEYEVIFVTASPDDSSIPLLRQLAANFYGHKIKFATAGVSSERGEKVNNLIQALARVDLRSEVFVFTDSDVRPHSTWLRDLLSPLAEERVGVSTGYRWLFLSKGNFPSVLRSAWNGSIATLLGNHEHNFAWGGSMAMRRSTFERAQVLAYWKHSLSDDYSLSRAMKDAKLRIHYEPRCLMPSYGDCSWRDLLEWSTRQIIITKVYSRRLWRLAIASQFPFVIGWWWATGQWALAVARIFIAEDGLRLSPLPQQLQHFGTIAALVYFLGVVRGFLRMQTVKLIRLKERANIDRFWWGYVLLSPLVSTLTAYNLIVSILTSTFNWRGVRYELISASEVRVVRGW